MAAIVSIISIGVVLELKRVIETNLIGVATYHCVSCFFHFNSYLKQLYISNKMEFIKVGVEWQIFTVNLGY